MTRIGILAVALSMTIALAGCVSESPRAAIIAGLQGDAGRGRASFAAHCASCHKSESTRNTAAWFPRDAFLSIIVDGGSSERMPSFAALSDQEIADIYAYLRTPAP